MRNAALKLRLYYNRWYLGHLIQSAMRGIGNYDTAIGKAIKDQKAVVEKLEALMHENLNAKG